MPNEALRMVTGGKADQIEMFHDSISAAIQTAINALGGSKQVASTLWPSMNLDAAYTRLRHSLNEDRPEKLSPDEVLLIMRRAAAVGCHAIAQYHGHEAGYEFTPLDPDEQKKRARKARKAALLAELQRLMDDE